MAIIRGGQLTGRLSWTPGLTEAARRYTREKTEENLAGLESAKLEAAREAVALQSSYGFEFVTDGGAGVVDVFTPYAEGLEGVGSGGNIDKYPGTRNSYFHTPVVTGEIRPKAVAARFLVTSALEGKNKKAILPSPAALSLASEDSHYRSPEELMLAYAEVLREDVRDLAASGFGFVQLTECFINNPRFAKAAARLAPRFGECVERVFQGFRGASCVYFHSGDAAPFLPALEDAGVTTLGFDFNTDPSAARGALEGKGAILGLQNSTRKLPGEWLDEEPVVLAARAREYVNRLGLGEGAEVFLAPSQDYDGLQTYPQAKRRLDNLARAIRILGGRA